MRFRGIMKPLPIAGEKVRRVREEFARGVLALQRPQRAVFPRAGAFVGVLQIDGTDLEDVIAERCEPTSVPLIFVGHGDRFEQREYLRASSSREAFDVGGMVSQAEAAKHAAELIR